MNPTDIINRIDWDFQYHAPTEQQKEAHQAVRDIMRRAAHHVLDHTPIGREQALAITKLEEAMFWANAAIARDKNAIG